MTKESIFMQMHNGKRPGEGSFNVGLQKLFYTADLGNRRKLVAAFPEFFGDEVPEFGVKTTEKEKIAHLFKCADGISCFVSLGLCDIQTRNEEPSYGKDYQIKLSRSQFSAQQFQAHSPERKNEEVSIALLHLRRVAEPAARVAQEADAKHRHKCITSPESKKSQEEYALESLLNVVFDHTIPLLKKLEYNRNLRP